MELLWTVLFILIDVWKAIDIICPFQYDLCHMYLTSQTKAQSNLTRFGPAEEKMNTDYLLDI